MSPTASEGGAERPIDLSVVIPTLNGGRLFREVLAAVAAQVFDGSVEYVVVDSGSSDGSDAAAAARGWKVISIQGEQFHHGRTRNLAVGRTRGCYIVLMTQDAVPADRFLFQRLTAPFADPEVGGVCARQVPRPDADPITRRHMALWPASSTRPRRSNARSLDELQLLPPHEQYMECRFDNVCGAVRRAAWQRHPFPECHFGEDLAWGLRAVCGGWKICYQPQAVVIHSHDRSPTYEFKRSYCFAWQLKDLFGIRDLPTRLSAVRWAIASMSDDLNFLLRTPLPRVEKWRTGARAALRTVAAGAGQYLGASDRRKNLRRRMNGI